jgi:4-hydroxybenzoate polyprenyltransferase
MFNPDQKIVRILFRSPGGLGALAVQPFFRIRTNRWWVYQRERFPIVGHGLLIAAFSFSAVSFSSVLRGRVAPPELASLIAAFASAFLFFLQLRIADEFKDHEEDARCRPYRPVPRGLVSLPELGTVGVAAALVQLGLGLWLGSALAVLLLPVWAYLGLMSKEFFARDWLKARPFTYMWTHMLIMPLIDLYSTACDWWTAAGVAPPGLAWFLVVSFFNGMVIEIGRKIRAPQDEEPGVETYTAVWGRRKAVLAWLGSLLLTGASAVLAASLIGLAASMAAVLAALLGLAAAVGWSFLRRPVTARARLFEPMSGAWTLVVYLGLGGLPLLMRA